MKKVSYSSQRAINLKAAVSLTVVLYVSVKSAVHFHYQNPKLRLL